MVRLPAHLDTCSHVVKLMYRLHLTYYIARPHLLPGLPPDGIFDATTASDTGPTNQQRHPAEGNPCHGPAAGRDAPHAAHGQNAARLVGLLGPAQHLPSVPIDAKATAKYPERPQQAQRPATSTTAAPTVGLTPGGNEPPEQHRRRSADARCPESLASANDGWTSAGSSAGQCRRQ